MKIWPGEAWSITLSFDAVPAVFRAAAASYFSLPCLKCSGEAPTAREYRVRDFAENCMDSYDGNKKLPAPVSPSWKTMAEMMLAAKIYESNAQLYRAAGP